MTIAHRSWLWLWLSIAMFLGVLVREAYHLATDDVRVPVIFQKAEVLNSPIHAGEELHVRVWREKVRGDCPVVSEPFAINVNGVLHPMPNSFAAGGPVGTPYVDIFYKTPPDLPPGEYVLRDRLSYRCPDHVFNILQPLARFVIN